MRKDLMQGLEIRKRNEQALAELQHEFQRYRQQVEEQKNLDLQEIMQLQNHVKEINFQYEETLLRLDQKTEECVNLSNDSMHWRDTADKLNTENNQLKDVIEDLEDKNRRLVDKMNQQILHRVTEYKEKALQALTRTDSPSKLRRACGQSDLRLNQVLTDENRPPVENRASPLRSMPANMPPLGSVGKYGVVRELQRIEEQRPHVE